MSRSRSRTAMLALTLPILFATPGCLDPSAADSLRARALAARDGLAAEEAAWLTRVAESPPEARPAAEAALALARARHAAADAAVRQVDLVLAEAKNPSDPFAAAVGAVAPWLPEPVRTPLTLAAALVVTLARARQLKRATASIARGLERAMKDDASFAEKFREHAGLFRTTQTALAGRIVDEVTKERFMLRLPV